MSPDDPTAMAVWTARPPGAHRAGRALVAFVVAALLAVTQLVSPPAASGSESGAITGISNGAVSTNASSIDLHAGCYNPNHNYPICLTSSDPAVTIGDPTIVFVSWASMDVSFGRVAGVPCAGTNGTGSVRLYDDKFEKYEDYAVSDAQVSVASGVWEITGRWSSASGSTGLLQAAIFGDELGLPGCSSHSALHYGALQLVPTDGEPQDLLDLLPQGFNESDKCRFSGGTQVMDSTSLGVRVFVYVYQPSLDELWVCARVQDTNTGERYGGRLVVTPTELDPGVTGVWGVPTVDANSSACTTAPYNSVPGSHPIASGGIGPVDYMLDAYRGGSSDNDVWVCLRAGAQKVRVVVPVLWDPVGAGVSTGTVAAWHPDPGTP